MAHRTQARSGIDYFCTRDRFRLPVRVLRSLPELGHGFVAFWEGQVVFRGGRVARFETEDAAWDHLAKCAEAGHMISADTRAAETQPISALSCAG